MKLLKKHMKRNFPIRFKSVKELKSLGAPLWVQRSAEDKRDCVLGHVMSDSLINYRTGYAMQQISSTKMSYFEEQSKEDTAEFLLSDEAAQGRFKSFNIKTFKVKDSETAIRMLENTRDFQFAPFWGRKMVSYNICDCKDVVITRVGEGIKEEFATKDLMLGIALSDNLLDKTLIQRIQSFVYRIESRLKISPSKLYSINGNRRIFAFKPSRIWTAKPVLLSFFMFMIRIGMMTPVGKPLNQTLDELDEDCEMDIREMFTEEMDLDDLSEGILDVGYQVAKTRSFIKILLENGLKKIFKTGYSSKAWEFGRRESFANGFVTCVTGAGEENEEISTIKETFSSNVIKQLKPFLPEGFRLDRLEQSGIAKYFGREHVANLILVDKIKL